MSNDGNGFSGSTFVLIATVVIVLVLFLAKGCTNEQGTTETLKASGYTNITLTGWDGFTCGDDNTCTGFVAFGPTGQRVRGAVGCGWVLKGCTVRVTSLLPTSTAPR